jgi:hypothetical protein
LYYLQENNEGLFGDKILQKSKLIVMLFIAICYISPISSAKSSYDLRRS